jgi:hypothetical protein
VAETLREKESEPGATPPVCSTCNDTHRMTLGERLGHVPCTHCPRPCRACAGDNGRLAYCAKTPCPCACHAAARASTPKRYARFRADPQKLRVSIRDYVGAWRVAIVPRDGSGTGVWAWGTSPKKALAAALQKAERANMPGLNLSLSWAHEHPFP